MVVAHAATAFWHHFHPWITKNMDLETVSHFGTQHHGKITKWCPKWSMKECKVLHLEHFFLTVHMGSIWAHVCPCGSIWAHNIMTHISPCVNVFVPICLGLISPHSYPLEGWLGIK